MLFRQCFFQARNKTTSISTIDKCKSATRLQFNMWVSCCKLSHSPGNSPIQTRPVRATKTGRSSRAPLKTACCQAYIVSKRRIRKQLRSISNVLERSAQFDDPPTSHSYLNASRDNSPNQSLQSRRKRGRPEKAKGYRLSLTTEATRNFSLY